LQFSLYFTVEAAGVHGQLVERVEVDCVQAAEDLSQSGLLADLALLEEHEQVEYPA